MKKSRLHPSVGKRAVALTFFLSLLTPLVSFSQVNLVWESTVGSMVSSNTVDIEDGPDGSTYLLGTFYGRTFANQNDTTRNKLIPENDTEGYYYLKKLSKDGAVLWMKVLQPKMDNNNTSKPSNLAVGPDGSVHLFFLFNDSIGIGLGPSTRWIVSSKPTQSLCGIKFNSNGEYVWNYMVDDMPLHRINFVRTDQNNNVYLAANYSGDSLGFKPGKNDGVVHESRSGFFVLRLKPDGSFGDVVSFAANNITGFDIDAEGNKALTGDFSDFFDFDPGPKMDTVHSAGWADLFFLKLDQNNKLLWKRTFGGPHHEYGGDLVFDTDGSIVSNLLTYGKVEADASGKSLLYDDQGIGRTIVVRFHPGGNVHWVRNLGTLRTFRELVLNAGPKGVYYGQRLSQTVDIGTAQYPVVLGRTTGWGKSGYFVALIDRYNGSLTSYVEIKHTAPSSIRSYEVVDTSLIMGCSFVDSFVTEHYPPIRIMAELTPNRRFSATAFKVNGSACSKAKPRINSVAEVTCSSPGMVQITTNNNTPLTAEILGLDTVYNDPSKIVIPHKGYYEIKCQDSLGCSTDFGVYVNGPELGQKECTFSMLGGPMRPGRSAYAQMYGGPFTCKKQDFTVMLVLNPAIEYLDCDIKPDKISGDTLLWDLKEVIHYPKMPRIAVKPLQTLGDTTLYSQLLFGPTDSFYSGDRTGKDVRFDVSNSHGPNDLQASPEGACNEGLVEKTQPIEYTIRFQNTGSAAAIDIRLVDTLSPYFDRNSLEVLAVSHKTERVVINKDGALEVFFKDINLPSVKKDSVASSGFIQFRLQPAKHVEMGAIIENQAHIYFDFNAPIATNKTRHTIHQEVSNWQMKVDSAVCNSFRYDDRVFDHSGSYTVYKRQIGGCDSTIFLNLDVVKNKAQFVEVDGGFEALDPDASYKWFDCNNNWKLVSTSQNFKPSTAGNFALVQIKSFCADTSTCVMFGTESTHPGLHNAKNYTVYPNPGDGHYVLGFGQEVFTGQIELMDSKGALIQVETLDGVTSHTITTPETTGVYFIRLVEDDAVTVHRVIRK